MDNEWLVSWLTDLSLSEYIATFERAGYLTPEQCASIRDREQLKSIGVTKIGHLNRLFRAVEKLGSDLRGEGSECLSLPQELSSVQDNLQPLRPSDLQSKTSSLSHLGREGMYATCTCNVLRLQTK